MKPKIPAIGLVLSVDVDSTTLLGPANIALLEQIQATGSIAAAARARKISYAHAWNLLKDLNAKLGKPVVEAKKGRGGPLIRNISLTAFGTELVRYFRNMEVEAGKVQKKNFIAMEHLFEKPAAELSVTTRLRATTLQAGPLRLDLIAHQAQRQDRAIKLQPREFKLMEYLMLRPDQVVTRDMLLGDVWKRTLPSRTNAFGVYFGALRRKIDLPGEVPLLRVVRGAGFMLVSPRTRTAHSTNNSAQFFCSAPPHKIGAISAG
jgi:molybdate transport repressor ModE-like protein